MNYCSSCGLPIPAGQRVCSMCYGDPEYGRDGYYKRGLEEEEMQEQERQWEHAMNRDGAWEEERREE